MFSIRFWKDLFERAVKSAAQAVVVAYGIGEGLNVFTVDWRLAAGFAGGGFVMSALTSIASAPFGANGSASVLDQ